MTMFPGNIISAVKCSVFHSLFRRRLNRKEQLSVFITIRHIPYRITPGSEGVTRPLTGSNLWVCVCKVYYSSIIWRIYGGPCFAPRFPAWPFKAPPLLFILIIRSFAIVGHLMPMIFQFSFFEEFFSWTYVSMTIQAAGWLSEQLWFQSHLFIRFVFKIFRTATQLLDSDFRRQFKLDRFCYKYVTPYKETSRLFPLAESSYAVLVLPSWTSSD